LNTCRRGLSIAALVALSLVAAVGCGDDDDDGAGAEAAPAGIFVGTVEGTDAYIGIKSDGEEVGGYLCNGKRGVSEDELVSVWLDESDLADGEAELTTREGEAVGSVTVTDAGVSGEVEIDGESHPFSAEPASGETGIYREARGAPGEPGSREKGWIVLADGSVRGAKHTGGANIADGTSNTFKPLSSTPPSTGFIDPTTQI
jgi:hypothetical protein